MTGTSRKNAVFLCFSTQMLSEVSGRYYNKSFNEQRIKEYQGIKGAELTKEQKILMKRLIEEYINNLEYEKANE